MNNSAVTKNAVVIAGTDTDVGKTVFAAALTAASEGSYWKPVQAGIGQTDSETVSTLAGLPPSRILPEAYRLITPCSPHRAAEIDQVKIDTAKLNPPVSFSSNHLVIELAGGLMVPMTQDALQIELLARWKIPVVLCARTTLGTINHTLLSVFALQACNVPLVGVAFIGDCDPGAEEAIVSFGETTHLGRLPVCTPLNATTLRQAFDANFDVAQIFAPPQGALA
ncbi:MAG: dethiobiotin synthase [Hyphomicrobiaceae bacterium]